MDRLMVGLFHELAQAEQAASALLDAGFPRESMSVFFVNPQGQHALHPVGGDEDESPGTHEARSGVAAGALTGGGAGAILGALTIPVLGPIGPIVGAGVGAYGGALVGALNRMEEPGSPDVADAEPVAPKQAVVTGDTTVAEKQDASDTPIPRKAGFLVAVAIKNEAQEHDALDILNKHAEEVEEATGELRDGDWIDFDPLRPKKLIFGAGTGPRL